MNDKACFLKIEKSETQIEKNMEQDQVLINLMAGGYLEPALLIEKVMFWIRETKN